MHKLHQWVFIFIFEEEEKWKKKYGKLLKRKLSQVKRGFSLWLRQHCSQSYINSQIFFSLFSLFLLLPSSLKLCVEQNSIAITLPNGNWSIFRWQKTATAFVYPSLAYLWKYSILIAYSDVATAKKKFLLFFSLWVVWINWKVCVCVFL